MKNPFKDGEYLLPITSVNSLVVHGVTASKLFSPRLIIYDVLSYLDDEFRNSSEVLRLFDERIFTDERFLGVARKYAIHLRDILNVLLNPSEEDKAVNIKWQEKHFAYWQNLHKIYVVGGLVLPNFKKVMDDVLKDLLKPVELVLISTDYATLGLSTLVKGEEALVFDFGQTSIKSRLVGINERVLEKEEAKYLYDDFDLATASMKLDLYMKDIIFKKIEETSFSGNKLYLALSNYVNLGYIRKSQYGYGRLGFFNNNYEENLRDYFSKKLKRKMDLRLFHDTTAMSYNFSNEPMVGIISLGTAFGVGFTS